MVIDCIGIVNKVTKFLDRENQENNEKSEQNFQKINGSE